MYIRSESVKPVASKIAALNSTIDFSSILFFYALSENRQFRCTFYKNGCFVYMSRCHIKVKTGLKMYHSCPVLVILLRVYQYMRDMPFWHASFGWVLHYKWHWCLFDKVLYTSLLQPFTLYTQKKEILTFTIHSKQNVTVEQENFVNSRRREVRESTFSRQENFTNPPIFYCFRVVEVGRWILNVHVFFWTQYEG